MEMDRSSEVAVEEDLEESNEVFIKFKTKLKGHRITEEPISLPGKLRRLGLSQAVNHLLGYTEPVPFDFLIKGLFLRTSLSKFLKRNNLTEEPIIEVEYVLALGEPKTSDSYEHEDWVSALDKHQNTKDENIIISGCYDSIIRFWKLKDTETPLFALTGHTGPIKALASSKLYSGDLFLVSASQDQTLKAWTVQPSAGTGRCTHTLTGHLATVLCCDAFPSPGAHGSDWRGLVASGGWDSYVKLWKFRSGADEGDDLEDTEEKTASRATKKRKIAKQEEELTAAVSFVGHKQAVSAVEWASEDVLISGSWDFTVKYWDVESGINTETKYSNKPIQSLSYSPFSKTVVTAHSDNVLRLWDQRSDQQQTYQGFTSHTNWVSSVAFHPSNPDIFLSASYDKTVKVWDLRSNTPLHTLSAHTEKVLTAAWYNNDLFLSGGADSQLKSFLLK